MSPGDDTHRSHRNLQLRFCTVYDNTGDPAYTQNHSGNGIVLGDVKCGLIEHCRAPCSAVARLSAGNCQW
jgi:hypothetical protein